MCKATATSAVPPPQLQVRDRSSLRAPPIGVNVRPLQPRARARRLDVASPHGRHAIDDPLRPRIDGRHDRISSGQKLVERIVL